MMRTVATANWRPTVHTNPLNCNSGTGADGADANFVAFTGGSMSGIEG